MKKLPTVLLLVMLGCQGFCADTTQKISNEKSYASLNLNSQIKPENDIQSQNITNKNSWFNININRNTYKFYCTEDKKN